MQQGDQKLPADVFGTELRCPARRQVRFPAPLQQDQIDRVQGASEMSHRARHQHRLPGHLV